MSFVSRLTHGWSAFTKDRPPGEPFIYQQDMSAIHHRLKPQNERSIAASPLTKIAVDVASLNFFHARVDEDGFYEETIQSSLNECLTINPNIDQTGRSFMLDVVMSLLDEGVIAIAPVRMNISPKEPGLKVFKELRVARIIEWKPAHVRLRAYDSATGQQKEFWMPKELVAIVQNPFYAVMNEPNSTYRRLTNKLRMLDAVDQINSSGKLDLLIQVPYTTNNKMQQDRAFRRTASIDEQLEKSRRGIAYIDGVEKVTQLNRPVESALMNQVEYLTNQFYAQLGISEEVFKGTAEEQVMINYQNSTIRPIATAIVDSMTKTFLTKTARSQRQAIIYTSDPFRMVPASQIPEMADKLTRNEIFSSNEIRSILGRRPSDDPRASELRNKNLNAQNDQLPAKVPGDTPSLETNKTLNKEEPQNET